MVVSLALVVGGSPPRAEARVGEVVVGAGARLPEAGVGRDAELALGLHGALKIDSILDLSLDLFPNSDGLGGSAHWMDAVTLGFMLRAPLPGPVHVEAGVSAGAYVGGSLDDIHPLYTYQVAVGARWLLMRFRLSYVASFETTFEDATGTPPPRFGQNVLLGVGFGL